jgi:hypothetical protein
MGLRRLSILALLLLASHAPAVKAASLYQTSFEAPDFVAGQLVDGQGGFTAINSRDAGVVSTENPRTGLQSLQVNGANLELNASGSLYRGTYAPILNYDPLAAGMPIVEVQADVRLNGPSTNTGHGTDDDLISANLSAFAGNGFRIGELILSSNGNIYAFSGMNPGEAYQFGTPFNLGQYYTLGLRLDFALRTTEFLLDGRSLGTLPFSNLVTSDVFMFATTRVLAVNDPAIDLSRYTANFDNYSVTAVPEPGGLALLGSGCLGVVGYACRGCRRRFVREIGRILLANSHRRPTVQKLGKIGYSTKR